VDSDCRPLQETRWLVVVASKREEEKFGDEEEWREEGLLNDLVRVRRSTAKLQRKVYGSSELGDVSRE
jgi:hypothetical protein